MVTIEIVSPKAEQVFSLKTFPVETEPINFRARIFVDDEDITHKVKVSWQLKLSWQATYKMYQTLVESHENPAKVTFRSGGILRVRVAVVVDGVEYSTRIKTSIIGTNPERKDIEKALENNDLLKAIAWQESNWRQFNAKGEPLLPGVPKGKRIPAMRGLFQISEYWWGRDKRITHKEYERMAWQWDYNIETAKEIISLLQKLVLSKYPAESNERQWDRVIKAFHVGESSIGTKEIPDIFEYVLSIRKIMRDKEWRE
jgi:hypothetical protein